MESSQNYPLPPTLAAFAGQIMSTDAHEATPLNFWHDEFGAVVDEFVAAIRNSKLGANAISRGDLSPITAETVWQVKRDKAPGAFNFRRRIEVLDFILVKRQLMFPSGMGLLSAASLSGADSPHLFASITGDRRISARKLVTAYNKWCGRIARENGRLRPVAAIL